MIKSLLSLYPPLSLLREELKGSGKRVFLVGGALRDHYLKRRGHDLDFAVNDGAIALSRKLARRIKASFVLLDREHGSARLVKKQDGEIWTFDFTDWRGKSIQEDLNLRDFTINALAVDILSQDAEPLEVRMARRDLKTGVVRMTNPRVFEQDPLRLLRAFSLTASLGFKIESRTLRRIKKDVPLISSVAVERIREEIFRILASSRAYETFCAMDDIGLLPQVIPQLTVMKGTHQGGFHHLDVWEHSLEALKQMEKIVDEIVRQEHLEAYLHEPIGGAHERLALLKMAALLHDIGKPETRRVEGKRVTFHTHEHAGGRITRQVAKHLKLSVKERYFLEDAVRLHLRPGYLSNFKVPSPKAVFRYLRDTGEEAASVAILALADQAATRGPLTTRAKTRHHAGICHMIIGRYFESKEKTRMPRLLTGHDLIKTLKLKPSVLFGKVLGSIEEAAALGKIKTKAEALALARKISKG